MRTENGAAASITASAQNTSQKIQAIKPIAQQNTTFAERTKGNVFEQALGNFTELTMAGKIPPNNSKMPQNNRHSKNIGSLLNGSFGSLTMQGRSDRQGLMTKPDADIKDRNISQDQTKTSDEMLAMANNLTMKDMWAAA